MNNKIIILIVVLILLLGAAFLLTPSKQDSKIEVVTGDTLHAGSTFQVKLVDSAKNPIANQNISLQIRSDSNTVVTKEVTTNAEGIASYELDDISPGQYDVNITFKGNDKFKESSISYKLVIEEGSTDPVEIDTSAPVNATDNSTTSTNGSSSSDKSYSLGSSGLKDGSFYSAQSQKIYYVGEIDVGMDGHHWKHMGNNEWVRVD